MDQDGSIDALTSVEDKLASVFRAEVGIEEPETPEQPVAEMVVEEPTITQEELEQHLAEDQAAAEEAPEEPEEQPRDPETGQFTSEEGKLYAGRYKSIEELERAVTEKQEFIDRQANELGMLRRLEALERQQAPAPQPQPSLPHNFVDLIDEDPATAAELAYNAGDQAALNQAVAGWNEISPGAPKLWAANLELREQVSTLNETFGKQTTDAAYAAFARAHPDLDQYEAAMGEIAKQSPSITRLLEQGDPAVTTEVLDFLYTKASSQVQARNADTLAKAQSAADAERDALRQQQKKTAGVASATKSAAEKKPRSEGHEMLDQIRAAYGGPDILSGITTD